MDFLVQKRLFGPTSSSKNSVSDVHSLATQLVACGVSPDTIVLTWHFGCTDLLILRDFLEEAGYVDLLPQDDNCIPMIRRFRENLPKLDDGRFCCCKLEVLFPLLFPGHELQGLNHHALVDAQQLRLLVIFMEERCRPPSERDARRLLFPGRQRDLREMFRGTGRVGGE